MIKFLSKRVMVLAAILSVIAFFVDGMRIEVSLGMLTGGYLSVYRTKLISAFLKTSLTDSQSSTMKTTWMLIAIQALMFVVLLIAILVDLRFFIGVFIGMLLLMIVICINSVTERLGMTHNDWGDL